jgi:hypothetical protein
MGQETLNSLAQHHEEWRLSTGLIEGVLTGATATFSNWLYFLAGSHIPREKDHASNFVHAATTACLPMSILLYTISACGFGIYKRRNLATGEAVSTGLRRANIVYSSAMFIMFLAIAAASIALAGEFSSAPANETISFGEGAERWGVGFGVVSASIIGLFLCCNGGSASVMGCCDQPLSGSDEERAPLVIQNPAFSPS